MEYLVLRDLRYIPLQRSDLVSQSLLARFKITEPSLVFHEAVAPAQVGTGSHLQQQEVVAHDVRRNILPWMFISIMIPQIGPAIEWFLMALAVSLHAVVLRGRDPIVRDMVGFVIMSFLIVTGPEALLADLTLKGFALLSIFASFACRL